ncbi:hypothetical protein HDU98_009639 [Podochytrium sp. JEL0797]|nr:hypothetical protein HDU98_009639 [Podochytrium sp. JEL0797]
MQVFGRFFSTASASTPHVLRPYQQECIDLSIEALARGVKRQAVSLPVGSGKTTIFANLIKNMPVPKECPTATRVLVIAHRTELLSQAAAQIQRATPDCMIIREQGKKKPSFEDLASCDVVVASLPTLGNELSTRLENFYDPKLFKCIIVDEAHHAAAKSYGLILTRLGALSDDSHLLATTNSGSTLILDYNPLIDIQPLASLKNLEILNLSETKVRDLKPLSELIKMKELRVNGTEVASVAPLEQWAKQ